MANFKMDDYVDVAERIRQFYERFPTGSLQTLAMPEVVEVNGKSFVLYGAAAYRTPDDERPAHGWAWEPVPGQTSFTHDSELQNAETSAWGRAIIALGFETKHIASQEEVRNRQAPPPAQRGGSGGASPVASPAAAAPLAERLATERTGGIVDKPAAATQTGGSFETAFDILMESAGVSKQDVARWGLRKSFSYREVDAWCEKHAQGTDALINVVLEAIDAHSRQPGMAV